MKWYSALACMMGLVTNGGCDLPAPAQYDHAMLREHFGKSPREIEEMFGKPTSISLTEAPPRPEDATEEERAQFDSSTEIMSYLYSGADGELVFHFNLNDEVHAITYLGRSVTAPEPTGQSMASPECSSATLKELRNKNKPALVVPTGRSARCDETVTRDFQEHTFPRSLCWHLTS